MACLLVIAATKFDVDKMEDASSGGMRRFEKWHVDNVQAGPILESQGRKWLEPEIEIGLE